MRTILHIGMPKTGSTALQRCFQRSRTQLEAQGVLYPRNPPGDMFNNHRMLIFGFTAYGDLPRHVLRYPAYTRETLKAHYAAFLAHVGRQVAEQRPACLILSSETLFGPLTPAARRSLRAATAALGGEALPSVAVYLRRPSAYYLSALQQRLKHAHRLTPPRAPASGKVLDAYAAAFGREALRPRIYDRRLLAEGDIVTDFLTAHLPDCGVDPAGLDRRSEANVSVSAEAMDVMRGYRLAFHRDRDNIVTPDSSELLRTLQRIDGALGTPRPALRPEIAETIDYGRRDPLRLRDAYGLVFPDLDYRRLERTRPGRALGPLLRNLWRPWRLEEIVLLDPAIRTAILDRLTRARWTREEPARAAWVAGLLRDGTAA